MKEIILAIPSILLLGSSNIILKYRMNYLSEKDINIFSNQFFKFIFDPFIFSGAIALFLSILWWLKIIQEVRLGIIYPFIHGGTILLTLLFSIFFLRESISQFQITGIIFIVVGIIFLIK